MRTHLNLATADVDKSVAFYSTLLQHEPLKHFGDYALFVTDDPALELALDLNAEVAQAHGAHFGIAVDSTASVDAAIERLQSAGLDTEIEREETCCYAKQTKVWTTDPDGRRWEIYAVLAETGETAGCCA